MILYLLHPTPFARKGNCMYLCIVKPNKIDVIMQIVTTSEFRANQKKYFDMAETESILVTRRNARPIVIKVADDDDMLTTAELQSTRQGLDDVRNGRTRRTNEGESLSDFLDRIGDV